MLEISIRAETIFSLFGLPVTNTLLMGWLVVLTLSALVFLFVRRPRIVPQGVQNVFEFAVEGVLGLMETALGGRERAEKYFPLVATIFIFILVSNWFGIFPFLGSIGVFAPGHGGEPAFVPLFRSSASDINFTLALALISVLAIQAFGISAWGFVKHAGKYFTVKSPIQCAVGILEFISELAKILSFSFRLFGNIFAGEVLLIITGFLVPYVVPVPFLMLELFVGFVQALVFAMLTTVFLGIATASEHG
ncbi:MAG: ATP synthase F0 subunit A [Candidatus Sungbacteria bacterium RIFCSPLOWO2_01_FULL_59_16]|uniref:ATP synthase subunit a n=1 Tax=Candidatus Sungbacteria bacterium RIFCSPLOWO2_01_FULL_59_16 TaxID=1802280 RepID=A0A1G2LCV5_9BACT|nr:MAG: ATP synthase F0 subunit A [Candidatus Sungbacteria bacterium RIFCSPLOWO2_01_FULL_59_16]